MPTLEQLLKRATRQPARKPARTKAAPLWPLPDDPDVLPDPIQTMDFGEARTIEARTIAEQVEAVYRHRQAAIWAYLAPEDAKRGPWPWAACPPDIWDPAGLLSGEHRDGWAPSHWAFDFYPSPLGGLQHRVNIVDHRFVGHGVAASLLPAA